MKTKFLFYSAVLFFCLGKYYNDELIFYFFSMHLLMLFIAVFVHKRELKLRARQNLQTPSETESAKS